MYRTMRRTPDSLTVIAFLAIVLVLGVNFVAVRYSNRELPPFSGAALRFSLASLLLFALVKWNRLILPAGRGLVGAAIYGVLAFGINYGLLYWGLLYVSAGMTSVLMATTPLMTLLLASALGQEQFHWRSLVGSLGAVGGIGIVSAEQLNANVPIAALITVLLAALVAALSGIVVKAFPRSHPIATNAVAMAVGAVVLFAGSLLAHETPALPAQLTTQAALMWLVASSCIGFVLMVWVLGRWTASATSYTLVLIPLVATASGALLAGERVDFIFVVGGLLVLFSVYFGALAAPATAIPAPVGEKK